ncbi:MAG: hypothetical protein IJT75_06755 [Bacteroidaceae bacterium]|nr:hypothetical protein [Bacteroidaceae bacterium]
MIEMNAYELIKDAVLSLGLDKDPCYRITCKEDGAGDSLYESITVHINGQLFFLLDYDHKGLRIRRVFEKEDIPVFSGNVQHGSFIQLYHDRKKIKDYRFECPVDEIINTIFGEYESAIEKKYHVLEAIKNVFGIDVPIECIGFDMCDKKYYINDWKKEDGVESKLIKAFFEKRKNELLLDKKSYDGYCSFYKYTSLNTLLKMLQSQKVRMYSLPAMNDRKEVGFLTSNEKCISDSEED